MQGIAIGERGAFEGFFALPSNHGVSFYPEATFPVLVGHYKMRGIPNIETAQVACLDYPGTPCVYRWQGESKLKTTLLQCAGKR